jgi:DNA polymerase/3'-5' exonuclease PolX
MRLDQAKDIAIRVGKRLQPFCTKINIAGSIRREKSEVGDIELICLPRMYVNEQGDLFGVVTATKKVSENFIAEVKSLGKVVRGEPTGRHMKIELPERIDLDLFMPQEHDYYRQFVIRTGSSEYSFRTIAHAWKRKGWCGTEHGLRLIKDCVEHKQSNGKSTWECVNNDPELPPCWPDERSFFDWLGVPWIQPKLRSI